MRSCIASPVGVGYLFPAGYMLVRWHDAFACECGGTGLHDTFDALASVLVACCCAAHSCNGREAGPYMASDCLLELLNKLRFRRCGFACHGSSVTSMRLFPSLVFKDTDTASGRQLSPPNTFQLWPE